MPQPELAGVPHRQQGILPNRGCLRVFLTWDDPEGIALALAGKFPDLDPLTVRFTDLHRWITDGAWSRRTAR